MLLLAALLAVFALLLAELSWICLIYYTLCTAVSWWLIRLFLANNCELDFDVVFKLFEWFGYGTPRFLESRTLSTLETSFDGPQNKCRIPEPISKSVDKLIQNVLRDFVASWYRDVADGEIFVEETKFVLDQLACEVYKRMNHLDSHYLVEQVILGFHAHLERYNKSVAVLKDKDPNLKLSISWSELLHHTYESQVRPRHIALSNPVSELNYLRTVVDTLLAAFAPDDVFSCDMGRFILREILSVQAVDLVNLLTDPDWVNEAIIDLLSPPKRRQLTNESLIENRVKANGLQSGTIDTVKDISSGELENCHEYQPGEGDKKTQLSMEKIESEVEQVQCNIERKMNECDEPDNVNIVLSNNVSTVPQYKDSESQLNITNIGNNHTKLSTSEEFPTEGKTSDQDAKSSLTSSWGFCPSAEDSTFHTQSFEAMKAKALERERKHNSPRKIGDIGSEVKLLGSCCTKFDVSDEFKKNPEKSVSSLRFRSSSLPEELCNIQDSRSHYHPEGTIISNRGFQRSVSFPANISSVPELEEQPCQPIARTLRSSTVHPHQSYGSPYYNLSFCSSEGSFKSINSDVDVEVEEGQEIDEGSESDSSEILENIAPLPIMKPPRRKSIARQAEVQEVSVSDDVFIFNERGNSLTEVKDQDVNRRITDNGFHSSKSGSQSSKDSDSSDQRSSLETTSPPADKLESDSSFGDTVIMAGKKFISSIRSPVKKFGFSSSSSKSTSMSSGADSMEVNVPSSIDTASFDSDLPFKKPIKTDSPSSGRKLSRSNAVMIDMSSESDTETWYGTPTASSIKEEIVYGMPQGSSGDMSNGIHRPVVKIHPSQMITIPSSETALESEWEPGRSKFTLYRIEYDIRIWPSIYKALKEENELDELPENDDKDGEKSKEQESKKMFHHKRAIKRRYREFMELHSRLTSGPMAIFMKDILKPNRKYNLPFGRLDRDVVEGRRSLLQYYLVSLVSKPELRDSHELQQFLGVIGGGSFIKPSVAQIMSQSVHVPRVDKMLSRQVTKVIDSIKTAFDSEDQEDFESGKVSPVVDIGSPWAIQCHADLDDSPVLEGNQVAYEDCFSAFLENLELSKPVTYLYSSGTESSYEDSSSDDEIASIFVNQAIANDRSDIPNNPSSNSSFSKDDMLNGMLGSQPPGLCIHPSFSYSAGTDLSMDRDFVDFGGHQKKEGHLSTSPDKRPSTESDIPVLQPGDSSESYKKSPSPISFSKKHVEKLKNAAKKAKDKKTESLETLSSAKEKVKMKVPNAESLENIKHAKEKVKAFKKKIPNVESMENIHQAKEKVKTFKKNFPDPESLEHITHAKEKVQAFKKKIPNVESMENLAQAKEKVKSFKMKIQDAESLESISHAKEKVKSFKKKIPNVHVEPMENLGQAKEKVKELKKKIPSPQNLIKKAQSSSNQNLDSASDDVSYRGHGNSSETVSSSASLYDKPEQPLAMSDYDDPSQEVTDIVNDICPEDPQFPLSHAILNLTCEVLKGHQSWAGIDRVQAGFLGVVGGLFEWFIRGEIDDVLTDQCWSDYLDNLHDVIWPNGKLIEPTEDMKSDEEKEQTKQKAVYTLMEFFPDIFQLLVGSKTYRECAMNAVESLQNPAINRILIYILLELFLSELVPELQRSMVRDVHSDDPE